MVASLRTHSHLRRIAPSFALLLVWAACLRSHGTEGDEPRADLALAFCGHLQRCYPDTLNAFRGQSVTSCAEAVRVAPFRETLERARNRQACAQELGGPCAILILHGKIVSLGSTPFPVFTRTSACGPEVLVPGAAKPEGATCSDEEPDCGDRMGCLFDPQVRRSESPLRGRCVPAAHPGEACSESQHCFADLTLTAPCVDGRCKREVGDRCVRDSECSTGQCRRGLCSLTPPLVASGEARGRPCDRRMWTSCERDLTLVCLDGACAPRRDVGENCEDSPDCRLGLVCSDSRCVLLEESEPARAGETCGPYGPVCADDTVCAGETCIAIEG